MASRDASESVAPAQTASPPLVPQDEATEGERRRPSGINERAKVLDRLLLRTLRRRDRWMLRAVDAEMALQDIANVDPVDAALDPTRPLRIAGHALRERGMSVPAMWPLFHQAVDLLRHEHGERWQGLDHDAYCEICTFLARVDAL